MNVTFLLAVFRLFGMRQYSTVTIVVAIFSVFFGKVFIKIAQ